MRQQNVLHAVLLEADMVGLHVLMHVSSSRMKTVDFVESICHMIESGLSSRLVIDCHLAVGMSHHVLNCKWYELLNQKPLFSDLQQHNNWIYLTIARA